MPDNIILSGSPVEIADFQTYKLATFLISVLDEYDLCGRMIPKESGEMYHSTIRGFPIVAKLICDWNNKPIDFGSHEMTIVRDENNNKTAKFGTIAIGSVINSWIEDRIVQGYVGTKSCIMIQAKLWSDRYPEYFKVLDKLWADNNVKSSWELKANSVEEDGSGRKILRAFTFLGNALLGSKVTAAVNGAGVYQYASAENENQEEYCLSQALCKDLSINNERRVNNLNENQTEEVVEVTPEATKVEEPIVAESTEKTEEQKTEEVEVSKCGDKEGKKKDEKADVEPVVEQKNEPEVSDAQKIAELSEALIASTKVVAELKEQVATLQSYKDEIDKINAEKLEQEKQTKIAELKTFALTSGFITEEDIASNDVVKDAIASVDKQKLNEVIVTRLMASMKNEKTATETASAPVVKVETETAEKIDISGGDEGEASLLKVFIGK